MRLLAIRIAMVEATDSRESNAAASQDILDLGRCTSNAPELVSRACACGIVGDGDGWLAVPEGRQRMVLSRAQAAIDAAGELLQFGRRIPCKLGKIPCSRPRIPCSEFRELEDGACLNRANPGAWTR